MRPGGESEEEEVDDVVDEGDIESNLSLLSLPRLVFGHMMLCSILRYRR